MIYTKTNSYHGHFDRKFFQPLTEAKFERNTIYWYDQHDWAVHNIPFNSFIDEQHWEHLRQDSTSKIFMFYGDEYYNLLDVEDWVKTLKNQRINPKQVYLMCVDKNWQDWTVETFSKLGLECINVQDFNILMDRVVPQPPQVLNKKFSMLSRNYTTWRLRLYAELVNNGCLPANFNYTFNNLNPYGTKVIFPKELLKSHIAEMKIVLSERLDKWIDGIPYTLKNDQIQEKLAADAYEIILTSGINVVVESHFDPYWHFAGNKYLNPQVFSPAFPTEKIYKAIGCKKPFILCSTPWFLKEFRTLGYKTFHPYIDESYDDIKEDIPRLNAIVKEINRICKLPANEFADLLEKCKPIAEHNLNVMIQLKQRVSLRPEFQWIEPYLEKNLPTPGRGGEI